MNSIFWERCIFFTTGGGRPIYISKYSCHPFTNIDILATILAKIFWQFAMFL